MTNAQIIFETSLKLCKDGVIKGTGRMLQYKDENGEVKEIEEPEAIHTYAAWKQLGYQVKKGSEAVASFNIWKHTTKTAKDDKGEIVKDENGDDLTTSKMFMKLSHFFTFEQVEPITAK